ncbi:MAG TPA: VWA domain-containing protein [Pyrinomonadaceae bacterium]|nr:VWA domain-containing protein [Pyrinomonadaceae bacterium]
MKNVLLLFAIFVLLALPALGQGRTTRPRATPQPQADTYIPPPPPPPGTKRPEDEIIIVETDLVTTPVTVMDRNGRFIPGLRKRDFKIFENGVAQEITYFQSEETPFTVVLMIDTSPSTRYHIDEIHFAALTFVNQLRPADQVMVVAFDQRARVLCEPTTDKKTIFSAIYKANFGSGTSLYDAVDAIANLQLTNSPGRKAIVLFTDGVDTTSRRASYQSTLGLAEEIDALFYPIRYDTLEQMNAGSQATTLSGLTFPPNIAVRMRGSSAAEYARGKTYLETLALNSGGRIFEANSLTNLEAAFSGVAEELRRRYSIGYYANTDRVPGERKQIKIQVARPGSVVRGKTNYVVRQKRETDGPPQVSSIE